MSVWSNLLALIFSVGAIQGMVFGVILFRQKNNRLSNRLLALILWLLAYRLLVQTMRLFGLGYYDTWYYFMLDLSWVTGPLLYFYVKAQIHADFHFKRSDWIHLIPLIIQVITSIFVRIQNFYWDGTKESLSWLGYWGYVVWMNYSTIYVVASVLIIIYATQAQKLTQKVNKDAIKPVDLAWLKTILSAFKYYFSIILIILLLDLLIHNVALGNSYFYFTRFYYYPFFIGISVLTYCLGLAGFSRKDESVAAKPQYVGADKRQQLDRIAGQLNDLMQQQKRYRQPGLSLRDVAEQLGVKEYLLSQSLKVVLKTNFIEFINKLRIAEIQSNIDNPEYQHMSLLDLALQAGFNSKSTFIRAVKKQLGIAPHQLKAKKS